MAQYLGAASHLHWSKDYNYTKKILDQLLLIAKELK
jgi:hypothetical protein